MIIQSKLHHPNIVDFYRCFDVLEWTYMVLQLCENGSLHSMIETRGCLTESEVRIYTIQIAGALKYMDSKNILHRDLKSRNIYLDADMNAKIGDFGLATRLPSLEKQGFSACGTLAYMAPEVLEPQQEGYDKRVDLWSMGVIM